LAKLGAGNVKKLTDAQIANIIAGGMLLVGVIALFAR
jgi:hypothetical protein